MNYLPIEWLGDRVRILDQTRLPQEEIYLEFGDYQDVASAIKELKIRGAPAIGVAGAYAAALGALSIETGSIDRFREELRDIIRDIARHIRPWRLDNNLDPHALAPVQHAEPEDNLQVRIAPPVTT